MLHFSLVYDFNTDRIKIFSFKEQLFCNMWHNAPFLFFCLISSDNCSPIMRTSSVIITVFIALFGCSKLQILSWCLPSFLASYKSSHVSNHLNETELEMFY